MNVSYSHVRSLLAYSCDHGYSGFQANEPEHHYNNIINHVLVILKVCTSQVAVGGYTLVL